MCQRLHRKLSCPSDTRGLTLIELLTSIALLAVLLGLAVPAFNEVIRSNRLTAYANSFLTSTTLARSEAIKRNRSVRLCRSSDGANCATTGNWDQGWIIIQPLQAGESGSAEVIQSQKALPGYRLSGNTNSIDFQAMGVGVACTKLTLCRSDACSADEKNRRFIKVDATGRGSIHKPPAEPPNCA